MPVQGGVVNITTHEQTQSDEIASLFFSVMTEFFSFQNNPKDLDLSYMPDLDL